MRALFALRGQRGRSSPSSLLTLQSSESKKGCSCSQNRKGGSAYQVDAGRHCEGVVSIERTESTRHLLGRHNLQNSKNRRTVPVLTIGKAVVPVNVDRYYESFFCVESTDSTAATFSVLATGTVPLLFLLSRSCRPRRSNLFSSPSHPTPHPRTPYQVDANRHNHLSDSENRNSSSYPQACGDGEGRIRPSPSLAPQTRSLPPYQVDADGRNHRSYRDDKNYWAN
jgi:hypothetical protein